MTTRASDRSCFRDRSTRRKPRFSFLVAGMTARFLAGGGCDPQQDGFPLREGRGKLLPTAVGGRVGSRRLGDSPSPPRTYGQRAGYTRSMPPAASRLFAGRLFVGGPERVA